MWKRLDASLLHGSQQTLVLASKSKECSAELRVILCAGTGKVSEHRKACECLHVLFRYRSIDERMSSADSDSPVSEIAVISERHERMLENTPCRLADGEVRVFCEPAVISKHAERTY